MLIRVGEENEFEDGKMRALIVLKDDKIVCFYHKGEFYAMEAVCPHSGGPLHLSQVELVDIEDLDFSSCQVEALVCPWHSYKFTLDTGKSVDDEIFNTNVYKVLLIDETIYIDYQKERKLISIQFFKMKQETLKKKVQKQIEFDSNGFSLVDWAVLILNTPDPTRKVQLTFECNRKWNAGEIENIGQSSNVPERPARDPTLTFVDRFETKKIGKGGSVQSRIVILHALANIEQWAIDLAWDIIARYSTTIIETPNGEKIAINSQKEFFDDFVRVANEEATHFTYLVERLHALGAEFGNLKVHDGLWDSAVLTSHCLLSRLSVYFCLTRLFIWYTKLED
jgi:nitrite reductase/ring-hydroxylating ferredoxin subunit